ncbi:ThiM Hydroxyethylthiazole kinase sugar kinase family [Pyrenophora tritici-repentis]|nr:ThiM Hydroxyethylthiazole kinase sugar kinase family [Pyrenophora tritici-repentis]KAI0585756.1 ThiM Hydroxyethylthiazole kinase sugar kinase family [Pyrenophora tritici-repentis]KAI0611229.1 ThiM Hydroxyethylthiazole kinase sugar kinase family [Pyrenophora tritici-repentis]KAI0622764.1 ThiM Hydroxyethylthiazole kinase sugar kinase family [Pyrenophora tritici-repentis]
MEKQKVDYSLYLVTDSTKAILGSRDLVDVVEQALSGGVTIVQYRDKTSDTGVLISIAKKLHEKCKAHGIPLVINDRMDVALAVGCEGVHLGQDDMNVVEARRILGDSKIIGATVSSIEEARIAVERGADYLGIGTLYATNTKKNTKDIIGITGIRKILRYLDNGTKAEKNVGTLLHSPPPFTLHSTAPHFWHENPEDELSSIFHKALQCKKAVKSKTPLSHNMTNLVVQNFAANVALAIGASPIMANYGLEAPDLARLQGGLVVNMGTVTPDGLLNYAQAVAAYNAAGGPIVFDPVGAGATSIRRDAVKTLMSAGYFDLIKGNEREILTVAKTSGLEIRLPSEEGQDQQRGVDSGTALLNLTQRASLVAHLAARERNIILMTGATDIISDGTRTYAIANGHEYLGLITGSGCTLGTTLSAYLAANPGDKLMAAVAGLLHFEIAAERAAAREEVRGPGTFVPAFLDELWRYGEGVMEEGLGNLIRVECMKDLGGDGLVREV